MGKLSDSKPELERSNRSAPAILCAACDKELDESTNYELCPKSLYWHGRHTVYVWAGVCCE